MTVFLRNILVNNYLKIYKFLIKLCIDKHDIYRSKIVNRISFNLLHEIILESYLIELKTGFNKIKISRPTSLLLLFGTNRSYSCWFLILSN